MSDFGWRPIKTAPKNEPVLIYFEDGNFEVGTYSVGKDGTINGWWSNDGLDFGYGYSAPTHWRPLPSPPFLTEE